MQFHFSQKHYTFEIPKCLAGFQYSKAIRVFSNAKCSTLHYLGHYRLDGLAPNTRLIGRFSDGISCLEGRQLTYKPGLPSSRGHDAAFQATCKMYTTT